MSGESGSRLVARILGSGSSGGVPRIGGEWGVCDPTEPRNRRSRCSLLLKQFVRGVAEPTMVLIDTSPDMREQLLSARATRLDAVLLSHEHADQIHGIDDLRALVLRHRKRIPVFMDQPTWAIVGARFDYCFTSKPLYPAILDHHEMEAGQAVDIRGPGGTMKILPLTQDHGGGASLGFRVGNFAYCNDVVRLPEETLGRLGGLDILVVDALRTTPHPTHANVAQALDWIGRLKPKRAVLTNMHIDLDYRTLKAELPAGVEPAYDGMEMELETGPF